jgi:hypothetical protein
MVELPGGVYDVLSQDSEVMWKVGSNGGGELVLSSFGVITDGLKG